jgi:hypothetical protein
MKIYELRPAVERFRWLTLEREEDFDFLHDFDGSPLAQSWTPLAARWIEEDSNIAKPTSDFPTLGATPVFSARAVDALLDPLVENGQLLPLEGNGAGFFVYNVTRVIDALSEGACELERFRDGRVMRIERHEFHPEPLLGAAVFKVPQVRIPVFVTERFAHRVADAELSGFRWTMLWSGSSRRA